MSNYPASIGDVFYYIGKTYEIHEAFPTQQYFVARELGNFDNMIKITLFELQCCPHWEKANFFSYTHEPILISVPEMKRAMLKVHPWKLSGVQTKDKPKGVK